MLDEKDLLTANFNFDYETKFSDLGINIDASFSTASSTATHIYGDDIDGVTFNYGYLEK